MLPIGMPNLALISAYGTGGSWASKVTSRQVAECVAQRGVMLGLKQFLVGRLEPLVRDALDFGRIPGRVRSLRWAQNPAATEYLRQAAGIEPHRRGHPRIPGLHPHVSTQAVAAVRLTSTAAGPPVSGPIPYKQGAG